MRLDLFLKASRLCLRRTVAQELCDAGAVFVSDAPAKSSRVVRVGDEIILRRRGQVLKLRVAMLPATRQLARSEASQLYEIISNSREAEETEETENTFDPIVST